MLSRYNLLLVLATAIWGLGFVASVWTLEDLGPTWSNVYRYVIAAVASIPFLIYHRTFAKGFKYWWWAIFGGVLLYAGMYFQVLGLVYTTVAKSGFITVFYAFFIPLIMMVAFGKRYQTGFWALMFLAFVGMFALCKLDFAEINRGDLFTLCCALLFACHIIFIDRVSHVLPSALEFNSAQCFVVGWGGLLLALVFSEPSPDITPLLTLDALMGASTLSGLLILGIASSLIAFSIQVYAQKHVPPHVAGITFLLESIFSLFFGWWLLSEEVEFTQLMGCLLILISVGGIPYFGREKLKINDAVN